MAIQTANPVATPARLPEHGFGATQRKDAWWVQPVATAAGLGAFVVYATWAAFQGVNYKWGPYLSPMYSPELLLGFKLGTWTISPAFYILWAPGGFRLTCYYYRKAYYRSFFLDPPACAVADRGGHSYCGEQKFPLILQNIHRYFMYIALVFIVILWHDAINAFFFEDGVHVGVGTIVLTINAALLSGYTFGCHSLRHLIGGKLDSFGGRSVRHSCWKGVTNLNEHHMLWAWMSLFWVAFSDFYVRMVASGVFPDLRLF